MITTLLLVSLLSANDSCLSYEYGKDCSQWNKTNTALELAFAVEVAIDAFGTNWFLDHTNTPEINPILGMHPSKTKLYVYDILAIAVHTGLMRIIPNPYRFLLQVSSVVAESGPIGIQWIKFGVHWEF